MPDCIFCHLDFTKPQNTLIEETPNFYVLPGVGALVDGYLLIISKNHLLSMSELPPAAQQEYLSLLQKYRSKFRSIYGQNPIIFEHGSPASDSSPSASSVDHAHTHIMNHQFRDEPRLLREINLRPCQLPNLFSQPTNYIFYLSPSGQSYLSHHFPPTSQLMRIQVATDLGLPDRYDWRQTEFTDHLFSTIKNFTK